ncbi:MAG: O-antigen ligase family protein [Stenotrophomonas sp.]|uniref:O-antigen ligase family protein n=1 Tax=Stenotrophomonas sp. TaxID=69392 RepID=UPI003D6CC465
MRQIRTRLLTAGQWCAALSLFAAPINKPATTALIVLSLFFSLLGADVRSRWQAALREPVVIGFLIWFAVLFASALHSTLLHDAPAYRESSLWSCIYPALMASLLRDSRWRWRALLAFAVAAGLVVLISYLMQFGLVPQRAIAEATPSMRNTVFKEYTQQGLASLILMSMLVAVALKSPSPRLRKILLLVAAVVLCNVVLVIQSRTTYIVLLPLLAYWIYRLVAHHLNGWRTLLVSAVLAVATITALWSTPSIRERMVSAVTEEVDDYLTTQEPTSSGIRLWLWQHTLPIIGDAPVFGHGLNRWEPIYREQMRTIPDSAPFITGHPHQELLLILAEEGTVGLLIFTALLLGLAYHASKLGDPQKGILTSIVIIYFAAGLANGLWSNFTHRHVFILLVACIPAGAFPWYAKDRKIESTP